MLNAHYVIMLLSGVNIAFLSSAFFRHLPFIKSGTPGIGYGLTLLGSSALLCAVAAASYLLPSGVALSVCTLIMAFAPVLENSFFLLLAHRAAGGNPHKHVRARMALTALMIVFALLYATNPFHSLIISSVVKQADGFLYGLTYGPLCVPVTVLFSLLSLLSLSPIFRAGKNVPEFNSSKWPLALSVVLIPILNLAHILIPALSQIRLATLMAWIPYAAVCYLFFGYLATSRPMAIEAMDDAYVSFDPHGGCVDINSRGIGFFQSYCATSRPSVKTLMELLKLENIEDIGHREFELNREDMARYYRINAFRLGDGVNRNHGNGFIIREITEYRSHMNALSDMASQDPLTKMKNRRYLDEIAPGIIADAVRNIQTFSVMMLDIDHFKKINDTYGHAAGDVVLIKLCAIMKENTRDADLIVRYGGEEFLILCAGISTKGTTRLAERIRSAVEAAVFDTDEAELGITVSIGVCCAAPVCVYNLSNLISVADKCLYKAKNSGRNRVVIAEYQDESAI